MLIVAALSLMAVGQMQAQDEQTDESREAKRTELIAKSGERLAKSFSLEGDAKESFLATYTAYQQEMFATNERRERTAEARQQDGEGKKELTDEQATERIEANLKRQEQQAGQLQKRLEIQKRYYAEFQKTLKPAQILKAMFPQRARQQQGQQQNQGGFRRGGFGGPGGPGGFGGPGDFCSRAHVSAFVLFVMKGGMMHTASAPSFYGSRPCACRPCTLFRSFVQYG